VPAFTEASLGGSVAGIVIGLILGGITLAWKLWRNRTTRPQGSDRLALLQTVLDMKKEGAGFQELMSHLRKAGLSRDNAEGLLVDAETRTPPDIANPVFEQVGHLSFNRPRNWRLKQLDPEIPMEQAFTIESQGGTLLVLRCSAQPAQEDQPILNEFIKEQIQALGVKDPRREETQHWGSLAGRGTIIRGTTKGMPFIEELFIANKGANWLQVCTFLPDEECEYAKNGLDLIKNTLIWTT